MSTDRSIRAPHAMHANHAFPSVVPPSESPHRRCSRKKASKSRSRRCSPRRQADPPRPSVIADGPAAPAILGPPLLVEDRRDDAVAARASRCTLEPGFDLKEDLRQRAHLPKAHRARERETGVA